MVFDAYISFIASLFKAWQSGERRVRAAIVTGILLVLVAIAFAMLAKAEFLEPRIAETSAPSVAGLAPLLGNGAIAYQSLPDQQVQQGKIAIVEERLPEHPEKPQHE